MKTYLDCIPCFFRQALEAARLAGAGKKAQKKIVNELSRAIPKFSLNTPPPQMGRIIHRIVRKITRKKDPYRQVKARSNQLALALYPKLKSKVAASADRLLMAVELAIAGNIIDYGVKNSLDVNQELQRILQKEEKDIRREKRAVFNYRQFERVLAKAQTILYLADNTGETVFDRILIEEIKSLDSKKKIYYVVRGGPIINDALAADARRCGLDKQAEIIDSGIDAPGTFLALCSKKFHRLFRQADLIISKGQGNFEALSEESGPIFFLFMAKCPVAAAHVGCQLKDIVLTTAAS